MDYFVALYRKSKELKFDELETSINLPPQQSLDKLKKKGSKIISTEKWNSISKDAHDKAFTVANVMSADIVQEIYDYVYRAIEDGWSFDKFKKQVSDGDLLDRMTKAGWTGGENPQRLKIIFDTNIKMAVGKGKYERLKATSDIRPYWIYHQVDRKNKRHAHSKWNGRKFRHDDPIWDYIYPPSDFGCACWVEATADPTGVENGSLFIDELKNNSDYKLCPTKQWQPDTSKYVDGLRKALDKMLKEKNSGYTQKDIDIFMKANRVQNTKSSYYKNGLDKTANKFNLSEVEALAIYDYSRTGYTDLNKNLRENNIDNFTESFEKILNSALSKMPINKGIVFRCTDLPNMVIDEYVDAFINQKPITHKYFTSSSTDEIKAESFGPLKFRIHSKNGRDINELSEWGVIQSTKHNNPISEQEQEVLFISKTKYMVLKINKLNGKINEIVLKEI